METAINTYLDLFTPDTWRAFLDHGGEVTGFRESQRRAAQAIKPGDLFACYLVRLSRWVGLLEVTSEVYEDSSPVFQQLSDPFTIRFACRSIVTLPIENGIPIRELWEDLDMTREVLPNSVAWAYKVGVARSLKRLTDDDAAFLRARLEHQRHTRVEYPLAPNERRELDASRIVVLPEGTTVVEIPEEEDDEGDENKDTESNGAAATKHRRSIHIQAQLTKIGLALGFRVWIPPNDKAAVLDVIDMSSAMLLTALPMNADGKTVDTVRQIDVLWVRGRSIVRAFEVEETTAVYSGILRMADLIALQPQFQIKLHIVAPEVRREKVRQQILRPTFAFMEGGPLARICTYLSYAAVSEIAALPNLHLMRHEIVDEYEEFME